MPDPHTESGSQDIIIIPSQESMVGLHDVTALRFILRQPSPNWKTFNIEEIAVSHYKSPTTTVFFPSQNTYSLILQV